MYAKIPIPNHTAYHNIHYSGATLDSKNHTQWRHPSVPLTFIAKNARFQTTIEAKIPMNNLVHKGKGLFASKDICIQMKENTVPRYDNFNSSLINFIRRRCVAKARKDARFINHV